MEKIASILVGLVAVLHLGFMVLESYLWQTPFGLKVFGMTKEAADHTSILAKNQGLYNGILAAGLIWSFFIPDASFQESIRTFFLVSILIAGIFGAATAKFSIFFVQSLPALLALIALRWPKG